MPKYISKEADIEWKNVALKMVILSLTKVAMIGAAASCAVRLTNTQTLFRHHQHKALSETASIDRDFLVIYLNSPYWAKTTPGAKRWRYF